MKANKKEFALYIGNIKQFWDKNKFKKWLQTYKITSYMDVKKIPSKPFAHIYFTDQESLQETHIKLLEQNVQCLEKKVTIKLLNVKPNLGYSDRKRKNITQGGPSEKKNKVGEEPASILDIVTPFWKTPYEKQLEDKSKVVRGVVNTIIRRIRRENGLFEWMKDFDHEKAITPILPSPVINDYRNKISPTIGRNASGNPQIGFNQGRVENDMLIISPIFECVNVSPKAKEIVRLLQSFLETSPLPLFNKVERMGFWRELVVKTFPSSNENEIIVGYNPNSVSDDEFYNQFHIPFQSLLEKFKEIFGTCSVSLKKNCGAHNNGVEAEIRHFWGPLHTHEHLCGKVFRISSLSFFQTNSLAAERLFDTIRSWIVEIATPNTVLLDLCCGTGTIGQILSDSVQRVIGIEMVEESIDDARHNAVANAINNTEYHVGKVEDVLRDLFREERTKACTHYIGILDPPRAGLHPSVIKAIRDFTPLKMFVYVSCNYKSFINDATAFCKRPSKNYRGNPFQIKKVSSVDMFPHTDHIEMVTFLERD